MSADSAAEGRGGVTLTTLRPQGVAEAATVLAASFREAPNVVAAYPDETKRASALKPIFRTLLRDAVGFGGVNLAIHEGQTVGVAVWLPPGHVRMTWRRQLRAIPTLLRACSSAPRSFVRFAQLGGALDKRRPNEPHWYLVALGVRGALRGRGVGSGLLEAGTVRAERTHRSCYLETFSEANVRFYERHGFVVTGRGKEVILGGPPFWFMQRPPGSAQATNSSLKAVSSTSRSSEAPISRASSP